MIHLKKVQKVPHRVLKVLKSIKFIKTIHQIQVKILAFHQQNKKLSLKEIFSL
jgi:hypothetical protein